MIRISKILFIVLGFCMALIAQAQNDSLTTVKAKQDSATKYLTPMEYAFMMHEETNWLVKASLPQGSFINNTWFLLSNFDASFERKIAPSFSLNSLVRLNVLNAYLVKSTNVGLSIDLRWYYQKHHQNKEKGGIKHLSGNYMFISGNYSHGSNTFEYDDRITTTKANIMSFQIGWGLQRRFLRSGYFSLGAGIGISIPINSDRKASFTLNTDMSIGLAFTKDKVMLNKDQLCSVIKCHESSSFVIKSNLYNIINVRLNNNSGSFSVKPNIIVEKKLGKSPFSIQLDMNFGYSYKYDANESFLLDEGSAFRTGGKLETRWYYNLRKRMLTGKTGNGLAANYFGIGADILFNKQTFSGNFGINNTYYFLNTGVQRFFGDHFYFDYGLSFGYMIIGTSYSNINLENYQIRAILSAGYRF